ncbi:hypothetical protein OPV22_034765 [Ensete ventricosum]|uniref:Uncharacterized protein n=1 Tax=Ensete ventricosum TaxID=4639 RepID=A0AAV8PKV7_ENSVE|nr:hypothetical protein OPV22_034765 [Ensete ventricosum]
MGLSYSREGAARRFVRSPPLAARSGGPKRAVLACFWACCGGRGERSSGRGIGVAGKVLAALRFVRRPFARRSLGAAKNGQFWACFLAVFACRGDRKVPPVASYRRSPPLAALSGGPKPGSFWPVFGPFSCAAVGRSSGRGIRVAREGAAFTSFAVRRSPLARVAKNSQFWPVFGPFSRAAATAASGAKRQPSQHPGTPRVAQGWMGLSYSREGAARRFVRSPPLSPLARVAQNGQFWPVFGPFSCAAVGRGERSSGRGIRVAGKVLPFPLFPLRSLGAAQNGQFWPVSWLFLRSALTAFCCKSPSMALCLNGVVCVACIIYLVPLEIDIVQHAFHFSFAMRMRSVIVRAPCVSSNDGLSQTPRLDWLQRSRECSWTQWIRLSLGSLDSWRMIGWLS